MSSKNQTIGHNAEYHACEHLKKQGLILLEKNFQCRFGEIDLIMQDNTCLVFIEVRYRKRTDYGSAADSISHKKQSKLIQTAHIYLKQSWQYNHHLQQAACRFDVVTLKGNFSSCLWIKSAFTLE